MEVTKALDQISAIHEQLAKGEIYRGYRPVPVALSGACGLIAAALEPRAIAGGHARDFVLFWVGVGLISALVGSSEIAFNYLFRENRFERRRTRRVLGQFGPALFAGAVLSGVAFYDRAGLVPWLPGLWALFFGLGVFASRPYLPRVTGWVGLFYLACGCAWLLLAPAPPIPASWQLGGTFAVGQAAAAVVLYWNLERTRDAEEN